MTTTPGAIRLDLQLLKDLGYAQLTSEQGRTLLRELYETIELIVGSTMAAGFDDRQLAELEQYMDRHDDTGATTWLKEHRPNYPEIVKQCYVAICQELRELSAAQNALEVQDDFLEPQIISETEVSNE